MAGARVLRPDHASPAWSNREAPARRAPPRRRAPDAEVPLPETPWEPGTVRHRQGRRILLHLLQETSQHTGHADIIRESVDGANSTARRGWRPSPAGGCTAVRPARSPRRPYGRPGLRGLAALEQVGITGRTHGVGSREPTPCKGSGQPVAAFARVRIAGSDGQLPWSVTSSMTKLVCRDESSVAVKVTVTCCPA
ncbi:DUF664 domain-containing protein [Streptomyces mutomycini]|uniref:mycothiol transferase n=1 Tax=Streptomyces mutomycini TaxID=284036 RepID=UPI000D1B0B11